MIVARNRLMSRVFIAAALVAGLASGPAAAQDGAEARLKKVEAEVRALQRKVYPDGAGKYFEAEIAPPTTTGTPPATVAAGPVTDMLGRIDGLEAALARMTAQAEENANRMGKLEARLVSLEAAAAPPPVASEAAPGMLTPAAVTTTSPPRSITGTVSANTAAMTGASAPRPPAERLAAVGAIVKSDSGDNGEDDYLYGFRLWEAKFYPEAQQQLQLTVEKYPRHKRISYARNLLGRAFLDDGKPGTAAQHFFANYQAAKTGDRAPDSLLYLAVAMTRLKETKRACVALAELGDTYPQEAAGRLANQYASAKAAVKCN